MDFNGVTPYDQLTEKWSPVLDHPEMPSIDDGYKRKVTACLLENQEAALREESGHLHGASPLSSAGGGLKGVNGEQRPMGGYDPLLISLVRRAMPNLMAYDVAGVQPMNAPTGLIFALKAQFGSNYNQTSTDRNNEALFNEADTSSFQFRPASKSKAPVINVVPPTVDACCVVKSCVYTLLEYP